jgi:biotin synthase
MPNTLMHMRHDWTYEEVAHIYHQPFLDLLLQAQNTHRLFFLPNQIQASTLYNIKEGGCPEDCAWCGQSIHHNTGVKNEPLANPEDVIQSAKLAKEQGATRFCLAAAWRGPTDRNLEKVCTMVKGIKALGLETCITIGKLKPHQAKALKEAGLDYYNHNLESSESHFAHLTTTRTYQDRLETLALVRETGMKVCCGGIVGMGESEQDRLELLMTLANQPEHPQSVPINHLVPIEGTGLESTEPLEPLTFVRCIALARILMPQSYVRLSGGRVAMSETMQTLCFMAGANSIHQGGPRLLVTENVRLDKDIALLNALGITLQTQPDNTEQPLVSVCKSIPLTVMHDPL